MFIIVNIPILMFIGIWCSICNIHINILIDILLEYALLCSIGNIKSLTGCLL